MKDIAISVIAIAPCIGCVAAAIYLAATGKNGWGWFLFIAACLFPKLSVS